MNDRLVQRSLLIFASTFVGGVLNYLFNPMMARALGPAQYGELLTLLSIVNIVAIPASTMTYAAAKFVASFQAQGSPASIRVFIRRTLRSLWIVTLILLVVYVLFVPWLQTALRFSHRAPLYLLVLMLAGTVMAAFMIGVLQGLQRFGRLSWFNVSAPSLKILAGLTAIWFGFQLDGLVGALGIVSGLALLLVWWWSRLDHDRTPDTSIQRPDLWRYVAYALAANVMLALMFNLDILIVKNRFSQEIAGQYGTISLLGKAVYFFGASIALVLFPLSASAHTRKESSMHLVRKSLAAVTVITALATLVFSASGDLVIRLLFGSEYVSLAPLLWMTAVVYGLFSLIYVMTTYFLAIHMKRFLIPMILFALGLVIALGLWGESLRSILGVFMVAFAGLTAILWLQLQRLRPATAPEDPLPVSLEPLP